mmetsp:Transcript_57417/g.179874  ORF Transcript_57417/g.179874 Transcript_57417/m.179874 type:complete len:81 (-) Transcript_57417:277-519(-)
MPGQRRPEGYFRFPQRHLQQHLKGQHRIALSRSNPSFRMQPVKHSPQATAPRTMRGHAHQGRSRAMPSNWALQHAACSAV